MFLCTRTEETDWEFKDVILQLIAESSKEYVLGEIIHKNCKMEVIISCEPECIKTDYNGN